MESRHPEVVREYRDDGRSHTVDDIHDARGLEGAK
jgi:hypothetical protein